jgi:hypothetical protein
MGHKVQNRLRGYLIMTIHAFLPVSGFDGIKAGEVYERALFTAEQLKALIRIWRIRPGTIRDRGHRQGTEILQFVERRG